MRRFLPLLIGLACLAIAASTLAQAHPGKAIGVVVDSPFRMAEFKRPVFPGRVFDIRDFGAREGEKASARPLSTAQSRPVTRPGVA